MKNLYIYVLIPAVLFVAFLYTPGLGYKSAMQELQAKNERIKSEKAAAKAAEDARRADIERKATEDAKKRQEQRDAEERAKEARKVKDYEDAMKQLRDEAAKYASEADGFQRDANALELQLNELRSLKEKTNREVFELSKQVELAKVGRRNAEIEIQRMVDMVAQRLGASSLAAMPPPAPAGGAKK
jgi:chromosome segregation ATPase